MSKKLITIFLILILCACQNRIGTIKILDNLKQSDINGIKVTCNDANLNNCYLTENDETTIIKCLAKLNIDKLEKADTGVYDFNYSIILETANNSYEVSLFETSNMININQKWYIINDEQLNIFNDMLDCLKNISYYEKGI